LKWRILVWLSKSLLRGIAKTVSALGFSFVNAPPDAGRSFGFGMASFRDFGLDLMRE
jgi:hypothetical protein